MVSVTAVRAGPGRAVACDADVGNVVFLEGGMSKKLSAVLAAAVFAAGTSVFAAPEKITGTLVDETCYTKDHENIGNAHKGMGDTCAQACAKKGQPVALVTDKGDVYEVMAMGDLAGENNAKLVPHMAHKVTLTGEVMDMSGKKMIHATALTMVSK